MTVERLKAKLVSELQCDVVIPLTNQRRQDDVALAKAVSGLPLIIGAHDHEPAIIVEPEVGSNGAEGVGASPGTTIVKAGVHHNLAAIVDVHWSDAAAAVPEIRVEKVRLDDYFANESLEAFAGQVVDACSAVNSVTICTAPETLLPLSSAGSRLRQTTVGTLVCNMCCKALRCDGMLLAGACFRGDKDYLAVQREFCYSDLVREFPQETPICIVSLPGQVLQQAVAFSRAAVRMDPPQEWDGFYQLSDGLVWDESAGVLTQVAGEAVDKSRVYSIGLLYNSIMGVYRNQPLIDWVNCNADCLPRMEDARWIKDLLLMDAMAQTSTDDPFQWRGLDGAEFVGRAEVEAVLQRAMGGKEGIPAFLIDNVMAVVDANNDGKVSRTEFHNFLRVFSKMSLFQQVHAKQCSLRIISVNDVYELHNLPRLHNLILDHRVENTIVVLPGDFVAPSLLSSLDRGKGMIDMLNRVGGEGVHYVCFGNHENDIPIDELHRRVAEFNGKWLNSNMPAWQPALPEYDILTIQGHGQRRVVGLLGLNTTDKNLYRPGAFGGAMDTAEPIMDAAVRLRKKLLEECGCDLVIPMTHQV